ncbi:MAG: hypothetical protein QIT46_gp01 [Methanophagales virus PBV305]|uniref:DNA-directed DNA polymerase n=1 Tax=Methanophagales virus PBV305 TaxID=3071310 RepID=A0AA46TDL8_9VIRU|nr:MAG: hypothetical protein QIT46_gp01 [Methanophagales virus PBV305]UYL65053.1 MAG: hypothetical protein HJKPNNFO_00001 [Methanophagales virus PBV305]
MIQINRRPIEWRQIKIRLHSLWKLKDVKHTSIKGLDTETYQGYIKLLCDSDGHIIWINEPEKIWDVLSSKIYRTSFNFFYNLDYDIQSALKILTKENIKELWKYGKTIYNDYKIRYLQGKYFSISKHKNRCIFYDLAQFYDTSLDNASQKYLKEQKDTLPFDRNALNKRIDVWNKYRNLIVKYCLKDAYLTKRLGDLLYDKCVNHIGFNPTDYISKASLSKRYFRLKTTIPDIHKIPDEVLEVAFYAYKGGRFEMIRKGYFEYVELYDINSAYPNYIMNLIDITKGKWKKVKNYNRWAYYGFYLVKLNIPYDIITPMPYYIKNVLAYPAGSWYSIITKEEYELLKELSMKPAIIYGYEFLPTKIVYPFKEEIQHLYKEKKKSNKKDFYYSLIKILMNSLYGVFYEKHQHNDEWWTGKLFNPIYASIITANTRIQLFKFAYPYKDDIIAFATDSVLLKEHHNIQTSDKIGQWSLDAKGECIALRSGVYEISGKLKTRGIQHKKEIKTPYGTYDNLFEYIRDKPHLTQYTFYIERPLHIFEALLHHQKYNIDMVNTWIKHEITIDINHDIKRINMHKFKGGGELLHTNYTTHPLYIEEG